MMKIALVTYSDQGVFVSPTAENEDDTLLKFLQHRGLTIEKVIWDDPGVQWEQYQLAILKSPWDYFNKIAAFDAWLSFLAEKNIQLLNPVATVKWNMEKHYLQDIAKAGLKITPIAFIAKDQKSNLADYFDTFNTQQLIVKPVVSGGSKNTFKVNMENCAAIESKLHGFLMEEDFIVQPFLKEIEENGEWSFLFFGGKFSHALIKKAKAGDFRVQHSFGGTIHPEEANEKLRSTAQAYIDLFAKECLYARVDGVVVGGEFLLMELELIEPFLFLDKNPQALENYYLALREKIDQLQVN